VNLRQGISLAVLGAIHLVFILWLIFDLKAVILDSIWIQIIILSSLVLLIDAYVRAPRTEITHSNIDSIIHPFAVAIAGLLTYYLSVDLKLGPVIASAGVGFVASYLSVSKSSLVKSLPVPIYCGTFVGMCSSFLAGDYFFVTYAGLVAGLIYLLTRDALNGVGGKLGTIAFGGVVVVSFILSVL
jgi:hypothetical protein